MPLGSFDALDLAMRSSATMGEALERLARYYPLFDDACEVWIERDAARARLVTRRRGGVSPLIATAFLYALVLERGRLFTGRRCPLIGIRFRGDPPRDRAAFERLLGGAPVRYRSQTNEIAFDAAWLEAPCLVVDPVVASTLDRQLGAMLAKVARRTDLLGDLRRAIALDMRGATPALTRSARRLGVSRRTLQRRLLDHGRSYRSVVEEVRRAEAIRLVEETDLPLAEVAYLLGFRELSSFFRAFRRWSERTPSALRRRRRAP
jgi:AraC-like DNA-binding protein